MKFGGVDAHKFQYSLLWDHNPNFPRPPPHAFAHSPSVFKNSNHINVGYTATARQVSPLLVVLINMCMLNRRLLLALTIEKKITRRSHLFHRHPVWDPHHTPYVRDQIRTLYCVSRVLSYAWTGCHVTGPTLSQSSTSQCNHENTASRTRYIPLFMAHG